MTRFLAPRLRPVAAALFLALLAGCQTGGTVSINPPPELAGTPRLDVVGRQGWLPDGTLRYGGYRTEGFKSRSVVQRTDDCVRGCWRVARSREHAVRFDTALSQSRQRLRFRQLDGTGATATMQALADWRVAQEGWAVEWFRGMAGSQREERQLTVFGTVAPDSGVQAAWRFWFSENSSTGAETIGLAEDDEGHRWEIRSWTDGPLPTQVVALMGRAPVAGYVLYDGDRAVAAVDAIMGGHVWIAEQLPPAQRLVAAGIASAMLLRDQFARAPGGL